MEEKLLPNENSFIKTSVIDVENYNSIDWTNNIDRLLAEWCDNAKCYEWMHSQSRDLYSKKAKVFMIVINVLTTFSGLSNIIAGGYSIGTFQISWIFGSISIIASTLNIIQDKLAYSQIAESHRTLSNDWLIIRNKIEEILIIPPSKRKDCKTFMKYIKQDINTAITEKNASIPLPIRDLCYEKFKNIKDFEIPDICGQVEHTRTYEELK